jgi:hypothetical protein
VNYVIAGYSIVLAILFFYGVQLVWRRRRLTRLVSRVEAARPTVPGEPGDQ